MRKLFSKMWKDDAGIVAFEYLLVATLIGLALVVGLSAVSVALNTELVELGNAILSLNQSYDVPAQSTCAGGSIGGTHVTDSYSGQNYGHEAPTPAGNLTGPINVATCN